LENLTSDIVNYHNQLNYGNLVDKAYNILEELAVTLQLKPGSIWSEIELSKIIDIGRTPTREAVKKLELTHVFKIVPRLGIEVSEVRLEEFYLQMEVRTVMEKMIAIRAARFSTPEEKEHFKALARRYEEANEIKDPVKSVRIDNEFNNYVAECSRNPFLTSSIMPLHALARRLYFMQYMTQPELTTLINQAHIDLMYAIAEGVPDRAAEISDRLLECIEKLTRSNFNLQMTYRML
jgi:DNA-binding GntR family transcriptional regulator